MLVSTYILAVLNIVMFIVSFFILMNKKGYVYQYKFESRYILTSIFLIFTSIMGLGFGTVSIQVILRMVLMIYLICKIFYKINTRISLSISGIYSLIYILAENSIFWFLQLSFNTSDYMIEIMLV
ncbi:MAG: ATP-binding protein, partial [Paraclostridium sp.]